MKKIIVTTDLSKSSRSALRFAIQFVSQYDVKLIFFHAIELLIPTHWDNVKAKIHMAEEIKNETERLQKFVVQNYKQCGKRPGKPDCVVRYGAPVSRAILDFAAEVNASYICISTRGAGPVKKLIGTHTSALIRNATIPVFAIPKDYKRSTIKEILYASDGTALVDELRAVKDIAKRLDSSISILHLDSFVDQKLVKDLGKLIARRDGRVKFRSEKLRLEEALDVQIKKAAKKFNADLLTLFSNKKRSWFDRVMFGSNSVRASFDSIIPILVLPKMNPSPA